MFDKRNRTTILLPPALDRYRFLSSEELNWRARRAGRADALREARLARARRIVREWFAQTGAES